MVSGQMPGTPDLSYTKVESGTASELNGLYQNCAWAGLTTPNWYSPPCTREIGTVRPVPECLVQSTLYQRGWYSPPCTREMSEPRWTSERSSLDVNTVTTGTVFLVTDCVLHLIQMQCVNSLWIRWLSENSLICNLIQNIHRFLIRKQRQLEH